MRQYSHDVGALPELIKPLLGSTRPAAVFQPVQGGVVVAFVRLAKVLDSRATFAMPTMLEAVARRIPMPDYMREQMPDLMLHLLSEVVPLIAQPLVEYLIARSRYERRRSAGAEGEAQAAAFESGEA